MVYKIDLRYQIFRKMTITGIKMAFLKKNQPKIWSKNFKKSNYLKKGFIDFGFDPKFVIYALFRYRKVMSVL